MLIGLCGKPMVGKSEVTRILVNDYGFRLLDTKIILRKMAAILTGLSETSFVSQFDKTCLYNEVSYRKIMGELGNVAERLWGDSFLLNRALEQVDYVNNNVVVDSLRKSQPSEFRGKVLEVKSTRGVDTGNDFDRYTKDNIAFCVYNEGNFEDLSKSIAEIADKLYF